MKKKLGAVILTAGLVFSLAACSGSGDGPKSDAGSEAQGSGIHAAQAQAEADLNSNQAGKDALAAEESVGSLNDEPLFQQFLSDQADAILSMENGNGLSVVCVTAEEIDGQMVFMPFYNGMELLSFEKLTQTVTETTGVEASEIETAYAILKTQAGDNALVVRYRGLGLDMPGDESCAYFVFTEDNGMLNLVYACDSWSRKYVTMYEGLIFVGNGSAGAGDSIEWVVRIDETGYSRTVYDLEVLYEDWVAMYDYETFGMDTEWSRGCTLSLISTEEGDFYSYEASGAADQKKLALLLSNLESAGMKKTDDAEKLVTGSLTDAGIRLDELTVFDNWTKLD